MPAPDKVCDVIVSNPLTATSLIISWKQAKDVITGYNVYRGFSKQGVFVKITPVPIQQTNFVDVTAQQRSHTVYWYYVTAMNGSLESIPSEPNYNGLIAKDDSDRTLPRMGRLPEQNQDRILREVVRRDGLLLRRGGEHVDFYTRITAGPKCTRPGCFQPAYNQPADPNCPVCFGTTYVNGYDKYPDVLCKIKPITTKLTLLEMGLKIDSTPAAWFGTYPIVSDGDVLVRRFNNKRYELNNVQQVISKGILTRQAFDIREYLPTQLPVLFTLQ